MEHDIFHDNALQTTVCGCRIRQVGFPMRSLVFWVLSLLDYFSINFRQVARDWNNHCIRDGIGLPWWKYRRDDSLCWLVCTVFLRPRLHYYLSSEKWFLLVGGYGVWWWMTRDSIDSKPFGSSQSLNLVPALLLPPPLQYFAETNMARIGIDK